MPDIREQIIQVCKDTFDTQVASIRAYDEEMREIMPASVPQALIIAEFAPCTNILIYFLRRYLLGGGCTHWLKVKKD